MDSLVLEKGMHAIYELKNSHHDVARMKIETLKDCTLLNSWNPTPYPHMLCSIREKGNNQWKL